MEGNQMAHWRLFEILAWRKHSVIICFFIVLSQFLYYQFYVNTEHFNLSHHTIAMFLVNLSKFFTRGKFAMLENLSCKIKAGCKEHPPWPGGICTKCQPSAVTLNRQVGGVGSGTVASAVLLLKTINLITKETKFFFCSCCHEHYK